ncbi:ATP-dependent nuclease [Fusobacterium sp. MFO224]|uniref:ATP-dependent nuclease n=1 Tax=Fusobacterium sp. MFO224 TaxID=3378070 RepID=UPI0038543608
MELKLISIKNWRNIKNIEIHFENLMLLLGHSIEGTNDIISCILYAFNKKDLNQNDIYTTEKKCTIKLIFFDDYSVYKLRIVISKDVEYFLKHKEGWNKITKKEYDFFIKKINFIYIEGNLEKNFKEIGLSLYDTLKKNAPSTSKIDDQLEEFSKKLNVKYYDKELYRNILFEFFKKVSLECLEKNTTLLGKTIILFEEPELYLHPQRERELYNYFIKLTNRGAKIYIKTYSSCFIGLKQYKSICLIKRYNNKTVITQTNNELFKDDEIKSFNMNYWINPDRAELFFAKKVILVEGQTDKIIISFLAKKLNIFKYDYSIIECGSKSTIPQFILLLNNFRIPYVAVFDRDHHHWRTFEEKEISKLKNKTILSLIDNKIGKAVAFNNDIEEEIASIERDKLSFRNKPFNALKSVSEENYILPSSLEKKIKKIYS